MIIALSSSDTVLMSSIMIWCTTVSTVSLLDEIGACTDRPVFWNTLCFRYCCSVCVVCGCWCLSLRSTAAYDCCSEVNLEKNVLPEDALGARCAFLHCSSSLSWPQPQYDAGWSFSHCTKVQLQQLDLDSVLVILGHPLCRWPQTLRWLLVVDPDMANFLAVTALCKASLSTVWFYLNSNMVKAIQLEYLLRCCVSY
jgi:hypothetical protein